MKKMKDIIPDLLSPETRLCSGESIADRPFFSGIPVKPGACILTYGNKTRMDLLEIWKKLGAKYVHQSGGWRDPFSMELKAFRGLPGNVPLNQRTIGDFVRLVEISKYPLRMEFDYYNDWKTMLTAKGIQKTETEYKEMTLAELIKIPGAPEFWTLLADGKPIGKSTGAPYPGCEYEHAFVLAEIDPEFAEGKTGMSFSNATGARGEGTIGLNNALIYFVHDEKTAVGNYIKDALARAEETLKLGKKVPYDVNKLDKYAVYFVETLGPIKDEVRAIMEKYGSDIKGIQYAMGFDVFTNLPSAAWKFSPVKPHCFVKLAAEWELAVE